MSTLLTVLLLALSGPLSPPSGRFVRSGEFCFQAWFPAAPHEAKASRMVVVGGLRIPVHARNYLYADDQCSLVLTATHFEPRYLTDTFSFLEGAIASHADKLKGRAFNIEEITVSGMPGRSFQVEWDQGGVSWLAQYTTCCGNGRSYTYGFLYRAGTAPPVRGRAFMRMVTFDSQCVERGA